jgi:hypothetical protein
MSRRSFQHLRLSTFALLAVACSGQGSVVTTLVQGGASSAGVSGTAGRAGSAGTGAGFGAGGGSGLGAGGFAGFGVGGVAGTENAAGSAGAPQSCAGDSDCPAPTRCTSSTCVGGACLEAPLPFGSPVTVLTASACQKIVCDGQGSPIARPDPSNVPASAPCMVSSCDAQGNALSLPANAGTPCLSATGSLCDGAGRCVACLTAADCPSGQSCVAQRCVGSSCSDGVRSGSETDVDCGGLNSCSRCRAGQHCNSNADCAVGHPCNASHVCD